MLKITRDTYFVKVYVLEMLQKIVYTFLCNSYITHMIKCARRKMEGMKYMS